MLFINLDLNNNEVAATDSANENQSSHRNRETAEERVRREEVVHDSILSSKKEVMRKENLRSPQLGKAPSLLPPKQFSAKTGLAEASVVSDGGNGAETTSVDSGAGLAGTAILCEEDPSLQEDLMQPLAQPKGIKGNEELDDPTAIAKKAALQKSSSSQGVASPNNDGDDYKLPKSTNLIATLCYIMLVEVKVNTTYYSCNFNIAGQDMNMIATLAPTSAIAAQDVYNQQAQEETDRGSMARQQAWIQFGAAAATVVTAGATGYASASTASKEELMTGLQDAEDAEGGKDAATIKPKMDAALKEQMLGTEQTPGKATVDQQVKAMRETLNNTRGDKTELNNFERDIAAAKGKKLFSNYAQQECLETYAQKLSDSEDNYFTNSLKEQATPEQKAEIYQKLQEDDPAFQKACAKMHEQKPSEAKGFTDTPFFKGAADGFNKAFQASQFFNLVSQMGTSFSTATWEAHIATDKTNQGKSTATQKISESFSQYKSTDFERENQITNQALEFINTLLNSVNTEVQDISQASRALFQSKS